MDQIYQYIYYLLTESEVTTGNSDRGLVILTKRERGQYIKAEAWDFPVTTKKTMLISYFLDGLFNMDLSLR